MRLPLFDIAIRNTSKLKACTAAGHIANAWAAWLDPVIIN